MVKGEVSVERPAHLDLQTFQSVPIAPKGDNDVHKAHTLSRGTTRWTTDAGAHLRAVHEANGQGTDPAAKE